nr:hypothetical protein [Tanacetum cinerariifolium]
MVAYLTKSDASEGFNQVIDFLNGSYIKYALSVNLNIYVSCIKQFWNNIAIKQVNDVTRLQALVDKKKMVVTEDAIREVLRLDDVEGVDCLPTRRFLQSWLEWVTRSHPPNSRFIKPSSQSSGRDDTAVHGAVLTVTQELSIPSPTPLTPPLQLPQDLPSTSQKQPSPPQSPQVPPPPQPQQAVDFPMSLLQKALDACAALTRRVKHLEKLHAELNKDINWDVAIDHVKLKAKEDPAIKLYQAMKRKPQTEAQARKNMMMYLKNVPGFKMDYFKGMSYDDIRLIFKAMFNSNVDFLLKTKEQMEEEDSRVLQRINETPAERVAKRRKLDEEVKDLKRHLEIMPNKDDDVYTEATPLARKVPVVDYEIIKLNNKPHYKIIRADGTHQLYVGFLSLLRNFDREDLKALWELVKERFYIAKPKNFYDDFLLTTLEAMFEKPDALAQIWKSQRTMHGQAKVKSWKLLKSCGVHIITFTTTQLILFIERRYPLSRFTLDQMLNAVRLQVEEESEVSLELLRFTRHQHQEGQHE